MVDVDHHGGLNDEAFNWKIKGNDFYYKCYYEKALICYDEALRIDPNYGDVWFNKGNTLRNFSRSEKDTQEKHKKSDEALNCYNTALQIDPRDQASWKNKGLFLEELGRKAEAEECDRELKKLTPSTQSNPRTTPTIQPQTVESEQKTEEPLNPKVPVVETGPPATPAEEIFVEPKWEIHEPLEANDPVSHSLSYFSDYDNYLDIGASTRGKYHAHNALYREDSFKFGHSNGWIIVAVADGAGSANLSRVGSSLACESLVGFLELSLEKCEISASDDGLQPSEEFLTDIRSRLVEAVAISQQRLADESTTRNIKTKDLATTLLVGIHKKWKEWHFIAGLQIGDGSIVFWDGKDTVKKLGNSDSGQYASETVFITTKGSEQNLANRVFFFLWKDIKSIALMTDGVADDFFPEEKMMPEMFREIQEKFNAVKQEEYPTALLEWLKYERRGSFDDRTIALIYTKS